MLIGRLAKSGQQEKTSLLEPSMEATAGIKPKEKTAWDILAGSPLGKTLETSGRIAGEAAKMPSSFLSKETRRAKETDNPLEFLLQSPTAQAIKTPVNLARATVSGIEQGAKDLSGMVSNTLYYKEFLKDYSGARDKFTEQIKPLQDRIKKEKDEKKKKKYQGLLTQQVEEFKKEWEPEKHFSEAYRMTPLQAAASGARAGIDAFSLPFAGKQLFGAATGKILPSVAQGLEGGLIGGGFAFFDSLANGESVEEATKKAAIAGTAGFGLGLALPKVFSFLGSKVRDEAGKEAVNALQEKITKESPEVQENFVKGFLKDNPDFISTQKIASEIPEEKLTTQEISERIAKDIDNIDADLKRFGKGTGEVSSSLSAKESPDIVSQIETKFPKQQQENVLDVISGTDKGKTRGFVQSVQKTPNISDLTKEKVAGTYIPKKNLELMGEAKVLLENSANLDLKNIDGIDKKIAATMKEALNLDAAGEHQAAANLYNNLAEKGTELGRAVQAYSMLPKMSPQAIALSVAGKINKYNRTATAKIPPLTGDQLKIISDLVENIDKLSGREKNIAINELEGVINGFIPSTLVDKAISVWKAGLLTSLRTHARNLVGNTIMQGAEIAKDPVATLADILMSKRTGKRTQTSTLSGYGTGAMKGLRAAKDIMLTGFDPEKEISKFDIKKVNWGKNPVEQGLKKITDFVFNSLSAADKPFWNASYARSLYDQAGAEAINAGQQGSKDFIQKLVQNPSEEMLKIATRDANYATFKDRNILSEIASGIKRTAQDPKWGKGAEIGKLVTEVFMPFTGVPSSIAEKTIAYSPVGLIKGSYNMGRVLAGQVPELQRQAAQEVGRGVMGTGLFGLGAYLMSKGIISGQPKDAKESALWQLQGKQPNSILLGGKWRRIESIGPQSLVFLAGAKLQEETGKPEGSVAAYGAGLLKDQLSQTFLSGVQAPLAAIQDPARYGKSYLGGLSSSVVPNIVKDAARAFDPDARELNTVGDYFVASIPWLRNNLLPKRDVLGNIVPQEPTGIKAFLDLFASKTPVDNLVINELVRLASVGNDATPSKLALNQTIAKEKVKLTFRQLDELEKEIGIKLKPKLEKLVQSKQYLKLEDEKKAEKISDLISDVRSAVKKKPTTESLLLLSEESKDTKKEPRKTSSSGKFSGRMAK